MSDVFLIAGLVALAVAAFLIALPLGVAVVGCSALALSWATRPKG